MRFIEERELVNLINDKLKAYEYAHNYTFNLDITDNNNKQNMKLTMSIIHLSVT